MKWDEKTVLITGGNGFLGKSVLENLKRLGPKEIISPSSEEVDFRNGEECRRILRCIDIVIHLAGRGGGIGYMEKNPAEAFYDNIMMSTQLIHEARFCNIEKFLALGTVCSYPKFSQVPFLENDIWGGYPEETNAAYGLAKKMMIVQSEAYRQQYGFNSINIIPTNLYGPNDNFKSTSSHVIPSIIRKIHESKMKKINSITLWGDGTPTRDFLYVKDAARGIILAVEKYSKSEPVNLGSTSETTIKEVAELIAKKMSFEGEIKWDKNRPNGQPRRCISNEKAKLEFGFSPEVSLDEGLEITINWFYSQQN